MNIKGITNILKKIPHDNNLLSEIPSAMSSPTPKDIKLIVVVEFATLRTIDHTGAGIGSAKNLNMKAQIAPIIMGFFRTANNNLLIFVLPEQPISRTTAAKIFIVGTTITPSIITVPTLPSP